MFLISVQLKFSLRLKIIYSSYAITFFVGQLGYSFDKILTRVEGRCSSILATWILTSSVTAIIEHGD